MLDSFQSVHDKEQYMIYITSVGRGEGGDYGGGRLKGREVGVLMERGGVIFSENLLTFSKLFIYIVEWWSNNHFWKWV